ncbi:MAG: ribosome small subunit-dependent GTPase A [Peptoniphilaceae bacterium]|nr:ribosome small subunit-dependent GTPase A [Peptoniphilaceae bacterium]MDD7382849.1 ribosome small subunit-dependent GTPase A [Peptoniphilaceae bacterium]MDY3738192.1 ribosome small subunit-dependent GTPase A [Peptoniphilaceae bacterium]
MVKGLIIKHLKELYYVKIYNNILICKARGNFRKKKIKPVVGDFVEVEVLEDNKGYISKIFDRKNLLIRPEISNIDQLFLFATIRNPSLNLYTLDKYLSMCEYMNIEVVIVLSKVDLAMTDEINNFKDIYTKAGYEIIEIDNLNNFPKEDILKKLNGKITALSGASGVGKSSMINNLIKGLSIDVGSISNKTKRGKNTTRHVEIFEVSKDGFIFDTPGFDSFDMNFIDDENELKKYFKEFNNFKDCKFNNCNHINEPFCDVKNALSNNLISISRYNNYCKLFYELANRRKNKW